MAALACLVVFAIACLVGAGVATFATVLSSSKDSRSAVPVELLMLSPCIGFAFLLIPTLWLNWLGLPISSFASIIVTVVCLASSLVLATARRLPRTKAAASIALVATCSLILIGWPLAKFNFGWLSFSNDDMANYCLTAARLVTFGYYDLPNQLEYVHDVNTSLLYWTLIVPSNARVGSDTLLALFAALFSKQPVEMFMPLIIALNAALVCGTAALVFVDSRKLSTALICATALAVSATNSFGAIDQLLAQVCGLMFFVAAVAALRQCFFAKTHKRLWLTATVMLASAQIYSYPEITPFLLVGATSCVLVWLLRGELVLIDVLKTTIPLIIFTLVILNAYIRTLLSAVIVQTSNGLQAHVAAPLFWYYLVPSGPANFFGILALSTPPYAQAIDAFAKLGLLLFAIYIVLCFVNFNTGSVSGVFALLMLGFTILLFRRSSDYGLFKMAMYMQPFMWSVLTMSTVDFCRPLLSRIAHLTKLLDGGRLFSLSFSNDLDIANSSGVNYGLFRPFDFARLLCGLAVLALLAGNLVVQYRYIVISLGYKTGSFTEIANASANSVILSMHVFSHRLTHGLLLSDSTIPSLSKIESGYTTGHPLVFLADDVFNNIGGLTRQGGIIETLQIPALRDRARVLYEARSANYARTRLVIRLVHGEKVTLEFLIDRDLIRRRYSLRHDHILLTGSDQSVFNRSNPVQPFSRPAVSLLQLDNISNWLVPVNSNLGTLPTYHDNNRTAFFEMQPDVTFHERTFSGAGRFILLQVLGFRRHSIFKIGLTESYNADGSNLLPPMVIYGATRQRVWFSGRGAASVIVPAPQPLKIGQFNYFLIDAGVNGFRFKTRRDGIMNLYGADLDLNPRRLTGFIREVSLLDYENRSVQPPSAVTRFPSAFSDPNLLYSGWYEDGWLSDRSQIRLTQGQDQSHFGMSGLIPPVGDSRPTTIRISIDGRPLVAKSFPVGYFSFRVPLRPTGRPEQHAIKICIDHVRRLPNGDNRIVGAQVSKLGFN